MFNIPYILQEQEGATTNSGGGSTDPNDELFKTDPTSTVTGNNTIVQPDALKSNIMKLQAEYNTLSELSSSTKGLVMPDASGISQQDIWNKEMDMANRLASSQTMVLAGLYSMSKTGDSTAFMKAMANRNKTDDDLTSLKLNMSVVSNPMSSYSARMASSAALQRDFGIDAAKDYKHINTAMVKLKQLQGNFASKIMGSIGNLYTASAKGADGTPGVKRTDFIGMKIIEDKVKELEAAAKKNPKDPSVLSAGPRLNNYRKYLSNIENFAIYGKDLDRKEDSLF